MATFGAANASKHNPAVPASPQHQQQQQQPSQAGEVRCGGMETMVVGSGPLPQGAENAKKCNAKVSGGGGALGRRKSSGSGLEGGGRGSAKPSDGMAAHAPTAHSLINYLFYLMCIAALGATVYANLRTSYVEDKLSSLVSIEERLSLVEAQVSDVYRRITLRRMDGSAPVQEEEEEESMSEVVRKISHQIAELPRMRRDLSALKVSRKDRQAAVQQTGNECMCPPGRSMELHYFHYAESQRHGGK
uniref:Uncharacterized protein n=1 Tax=Anopheles epiroticus TaxID=199890 RepID=A0A182P6S7_9DIPT